jgi:glutamate formiminotransferase
MPLVECVVIAAESRPDRLDALVTAFKKVKGAKLLNQSSDVPLNQAVLAFAGEPALVAEAAFRLIQKALEVIPPPAPLSLAFVPLRDIELAACVELAQKLAQRVGAEVPRAVYLYGAAASRPERTKLAAAIHEAGQAGSVPDFGTAGNDGAIFIGARQLAFTLHVTLKTEDLAAADEIARKISADDGGLPGVEAEALLRRESPIIRLTVGDFSRFPQMPLPNLIAIIQSEAELRGTSLIETELVGIIPQHALTTPMMASEGRMTRYTIFPDPFLKKSARLLRMTNLTRDRLLEAALRKARL